MRSSSSATRTATFVTCPGRRPRTPRSNPLRPTPRPDAASSGTRVPTCSRRRSRICSPPEAKLGIGPPIKDGFYYDFDVAEPFTPEDLKALEKKMKQIIKSGQRFSRRVYDSKDEARAELANEPFKLELIDDKGAADDAEVMEVGGGELSVYDNLNPRTGERIWCDLCRGPHVPTTKYIAAFKLTRSSAAYWRGDQDNADLQRVYGTAWESAEALDAHLELLAEAEKRDHRKLGAELDLFSFPPDELGSGLPVFHPPKGGIIRKEMEDYSRARHVAARYEFVNTPAHHQVAPLRGLRSSRLVPRRDVPAHARRRGVRRERRAAQARPGLLPEADELPDAQPDLPGVGGRSYRELPLRMFEFGSVYRYEKSGVIHGLTRVRGMTQDDAHIYCTQDQMRDELTSILTFVLGGLLKDYGLDDFYLELSTKDPKKFVGSDEVWEAATNTLAEVAQASGLDLVPDPGGAAFYGPKISVQAKDALGRTWQMSTIQLDFNLPELFGLEYTASDGTKQRPVMIHRALFGSIERFFGVLTEHYAGAFPAWLSPRSRSWASRSPRRSPITCRASSTRCGPPVSVPRSTTPTTACRRRSATTPPARFRSCCSRASATSKRMR